MSSYGDNLEAQYGKVQVTKTLNEYPEHARLLKVKDESQACSEFLEWLSSEKGFHLAKSIPGRARPSYVSYSIQDLLAEFFEIDQDKLEAEKREMLATLRD